MEFVLYNKVNKTEKSTQKKILIKCNFTSAASPYIGNLRIMLVSITRRKIMQYSLFALLNQSSNFKIFTVNGRT